VTSARLFSALASGAARRPQLALALALAIGLAGAAAALSLEPTAATSTFVSSGSSSYRATQRFYEGFGEEPVDVVVKGSLQQLLLSSDIDRLVGLEGCLSGNVPPAGLAHEGGSNGPCGRLERAKTVKVVLGPGTFVNEAAGQIDEQLSTQTRQAEAQAAEAERVIRRAALRRGLAPGEAQTLGRQASKITMARFQEGLVTVALQYGLTTRPSLNDATFVSRLVFDSSKPAGTPKQRFAYLFPSPDAALISVRLKAGLSERERTHTIALIREAVGMPQWRLAHGEAYLVTGEPTIVSDLTGSISSSIELLLIAAVVVMATALGMLLQNPPRLLPLGVALLATALTFGGLSVFGGSLSIALLAVLPVLVGLAVDYAIQFQSRVAEGLAAGADVRTAVRDAARIGAPAIAIAGAASAAAALVTLLSPVPMVRGFGVLLAVGIGIAFICALTAGSAALALVRAGRPGADRRFSSLPSIARLAAAWRGARELLLEAVVARGVSRAALLPAFRNPGRVLAVGLVLAALGWGLDAQTKVQTDITKLVPQNLQSLQNLTTLERLSGVGGEIDLLVGGRNLAKPTTIEWMSAYQEAVLRRFGYTAGRGCGKARLCPAFSLTDLFARGAGEKPSKLTQAEVNGLLDAIPPYFSQAVITPGRQLATLAFGIRLMSLDEQQRLIEAMRASLHPPPGVSAQLVGLPVLAAQANAQVASPGRRLLAVLAALGAVALVLVIAFRGDRRRVLGPLAPVVLTSGWSALVVFATRVPLNPMSVTLGVLVIAISTEFSVLLAERYRQERLLGHGPDQALALTYSHTGAAVAASGVTAIAGFAVLALSDIAMLRDFGLVTLIDLSVSLIGVLVALPAALLLVDAVPPAEPVVARPPGKRRATALPGFGARRATLAANRGAGPGESLLDGAGAEEPSPATGPGRAGRHEPA
jgi:hydrophobe/amphiphile efflux-3 (HAE3) family protein